MTGAAVSFGPLDAARFIETLQSRGLVSGPDGLRALDLSRHTGTGIERTLLELGLVAEDRLFAELAQSLGLALVDPVAVEAGLALRLGLAADYLTRIEAVPVAASGAGLVVATCDPDGAEALRGLAFHLGRDVVPVIATPSQVRDLIAPAGPADAPGEGMAEADLTRLRALANDGPVIKAVNDLVADAVAARASDIHIEAEDHGARVRFRIDGALVAQRRIAEAQRAAVVSRLKVMAGLNISERRRPQDGRAEVSVRGRAVDIRLSTLPTQFGESVVLRLLDRNRLHLDWAALGFSDERVAAIRRLLAQPSGIVLVAGPTGSGKTTTLYTALDELNSDDRKLVTVEDPIEYALRGVAQVPVDANIDMGFGRALRAILRQDPDVIMIGEIRDSETAEIAVRAALVGRLVLSTVHTNDSLSAVDRLSDLGVPPYLLAATLRGVLSQRLVRRLCPDCGGAGCEVCAKTGRQGRTVISELFEVSPAVRAAIAAGRGAADLLELAVKDGFRPILDDARQGLDAGVIAEADLYRTLGANVD